MWAAPRLHLVAFRDEVEISADGFADASRGDTKLGAAIGVGFGSDWWVSHSFALSFGAHGGYMLLPQSDPPPEVGSDEQGSGALVSLSVRGVYSL